MTPPTFDDCLTAPLHFSRAIQPHGALLVVNPGGAIIGASANAGRWLHVPETELEGARWHALFPQTPLPPAPTCTTIPVSAPVLHALHLNGQSLVVARRTLKVGTLLEFEPITYCTEELAYSNAARMAICMAELPDCNNEQAAAECLMRHIAEVTGFDRTMLLQFLPDWHGAVVAEQCKPGITGYLHQHFPANDIPENARALYRLKHQRLIADACAEPVPILSTHPEPFDLTYSELRAVHPAHIQYMRNMGIRTAFSVSIVVNGTLWGLITCHNLQPATLSFAKRLLCEQLASATALHMAGLARLAHATARHTHQLVRTQVKQALQTGGTSPETLKNSLQDIALQFNAQGAWARVRGQTALWGVLPSSRRLKRLRSWLARHVAPDLAVFHTHEIPAQLRDDTELVRHASGLLLIRINANVTLLLLRSEQQEHIDWAGEQQHVKPETHRQKLSPRTSFAVWREQVKGQAWPWTATDIEAAHDLRTTLVELIDYLALEHKSLTDPLTGLGNRNLLQQRFDTLQSNSGKEARAALLLIDLDNFKPINDTLGHAAGDDLLVQIANRLRSLVRTEDTLVRLGGDEFAVVLKRVSTAKQVQDLGERLVQALAEPYTLNDTQVTLSASVGAALFPQHARTGQSLVHHADMAMYQVKRRGRNGFMLYSATDPVPETPQPAPGCHQTADRA